MKLDSHAVRIGVTGPVRDVRYSGRIGESHRRWSRAAVDQYGPAQPGCLGRSLEVAFDNDALGVISTKAWMGTKYLVHCVNELLLDRLILSLDDLGPCQSEHDHHDQKLVLPHASLSLRHRTLAQRQVEGAPLNDYVS